MVLEPIDNSTHTVHSTIKQRQGFPATALRCFTENLNNSMDLKGLSYIYLINVTIATTNIHHLTQLRLYMFYPVTTMKCIGALLPKQHFYTMYT